MLEHLVDFLGLGAELLGQGQHGSLEGSQSGVQVQHGADVGVALLVLTHNFLVVSFAQEGQRHTVTAQARLDDIGDIVLVLLLVEVFQALAAGLLVATQVIVGAVGNAPQLTPAAAEGELILNVGGGAGVEGQLGRFVVTQTQALLLDAQAQQPVLAEVLPVGKPFQVAARLAEELALHLLKFPGTEGEVARGNLVAEGLAHLANAEGQLAAGGALDVGEVDEDALCGFGPQVHRGGGVLGHANLGLEHQVKLADGGEVVLAAVGANHFLVGGNESVHLLKAHGIHVDSLTGLTGLNQLVSALTGAAALAVHQRVGEIAHMAGGDPGGGVHEDGGIQTHVIFGLLDELFQPCLLDVVLEFHTQRAVVPGVGQTAVNLGTGIDIAPVLAEIYNHIQCFFAVLHFISSCVRIVYGRAARAATVKVT